MANEVRWPTCNYRDDGEDREVDAEGKESLFVAGKIDYIAWADQLQTCPEIWIQVAEQRYDHKEGDEDQIVEMSSYLTAHKSESYRPCNKRKCEDVLHVVDLAVVPVDITSCLVDAEQKYRAYWVLICDFLLYVDWAFWK